MDAYGEITEKLRRSTVQIRTGDHGCGSGVVWSADGQVLTNAHVISRGSTRVELWNGRKFDAQVVKLDRRRDLAAIKVDAADLAAATAGDASTLRPGELVVAVGNPFGFSGAVSKGVVHSVDARKWVLSDVRLAPGNSGGPLANARGEVVGLNTMIAGGIAFAIPANVVARFLRGGEPRLGVTVQPVALRRGLGLMVLEISPQSAAEQASLLPGDILLGAANKRFRAAEDLEDALASASEQKLEIEFLRGAQPKPRRVVVQMLRAA